MGTENDMIDKMGITHDGTKIVIIERIGKFLGSPSATFISLSVPVVMLMGSLCSLTSITTGYSTVTLRVNSTPFAVHFEWERSTCYQVVCAPDDAWRAAL